MPAWVLLASISCTVSLLAQPNEDRAAPDGFTQWAGTGFDQAHARIVQAREIYGRQNPDLSSHLSLTAVFLEGTPWNAGRVLRQLRKTARILEPCGIRLAQVRLVRARVPPELRSIDVTAKVSSSDVPLNVYRLASFLPKGAKGPALFFIGRIRGEEVLARSYQQGDVPATELQNYRYMNTAWISYRAHWVERPEEEYSALAHEVAHLLCACGHEGGSQRHLLHEYRNFLGAQVLPQHCAKFRSSNLVTSPAPQSP